jgi:hypothetical protein
MSEKINLSLHKANKLKKELTSKFKGMTRPTGSFDISFNRNDENHTLIEEAKKQLSEQNINEALFMSILELEATLSSLIFNKNSNVGISDLIIKSKLLSNKIFIMENIKDSPKIRDINSMDFQPLIDKIDPENDPYVSSQSALFKTNFINSKYYEKISNLKKELRDIDDKINSLNSSTNISFEMPDNIKETFGF